MHIHIMDAPSNLQVHYPSVTGHEVLIHAITWMNLENMLNKRNQTKKITYYIIPFI